MTHLTYQQVYQGVPVWAALLRVHYAQQESRWGQSQIDLSGLAQAGDTIQIRFAFGADGCGGHLGWYVDDVNVHSCTADPTAIDIAQLSSSVPTRRVPLAAIAGMLLLGVGVWRHRKRQP